LLWAEQLNFSIEPGRPALFLDRDGVIVEEVHFLSRPADVRLIADVGQAIAAVNRAGFPVVLVTNQSGIARGLYDWAAFAAVQREIGARLARAGARWDAVLACGYQPPAGGSDGARDHPWRKPGAGMLLRSSEMLGLDLARSYVVGDRMSDLDAGANAGLAGGWLVATGYGARETAGPAPESAASRSGAFVVRAAPSAVEATAQFLQLVR
jgi:D-glycero-D-manno-heptose 1,7-bisphosphate phosphatase